MLFRVLVLPGLGLLLPVLVFAGLVLVLPLLLVFPLPEPVLPVTGLGTVTAATKVAKARAEMTLNCMLCFLL
jgi:hypothetical protein